MTPGPNSWKSPGPPGHLCRAKRGARRNASCPEDWSAKWSGPWWRRGDLMRIVNTNIWLVNHYSTKWWHVYMRVFRYNWIIQIILINICILQFLRYGARIVGTTEDVNEWWERFQKPGPSIPRKPSSIVVYPFTWRSHRDAGWKPSSHTTGY